MASLMRKIWKKKYSKTVLFGAVAYFQTNPTHHFGIILAEHSSTSVTVFLWVQTANWSWDHRKLAPCRHPHQVEAAELSKGKPPQWERFFRQLMAILRGT